jgi:hypothetical protein
VTKRNHRIYAILGEYQDDGAYAWIVATSDKAALKEYQRRARGDVEGEEHAVPVFEKETEGLTPRELEVWIGAYHVGFETHAAREHERWCAAEAQRRKREDVRLRRDVLQREKRVRG